MKSRTTLITGSTDGIGKLTTQKLAERGDRILIHGRDNQKADRVAQEIRQFSGSQAMETYIADFASLDQVRQLAGEIKNNHNTLEVLINNAGIGYGDRRKSQDGYELHFAVNYLAPFLLTHLLLPLLKEASTSRIVNVSSAGQHPIDFDDVMLEQSYSPQLAYNQSKLALIMFTFELADRLQGEQVTVNSLHPGTFLDTKLVKNAGITPRGKVEDGAEAVYYLATAPELDKVTGQYFDQKRKAKALSQAYDSEARKKLWRLSKQFTGL